MDKGGWGGGGVYIEELGALCKVVFTYFVTDA